MPLEFKIIVVGDNNDVGVVFPKQDHVPTIGVDFSRHAVSIGGSELGNVRVWHVGRSRLETSEMHSYVRDATSFVYFDRRESSVDREAEAFYRFCVTAKSSGLPAIRVTQPKENGMVDVSYQFPDRSSPTTYTIPQYEVVECVKKMTYVLANMAKEVAAAQERRGAPAPQPPRLVRRLVTKQENIWDKIGAAFNAILSAAANKIRNIAGFFSANTTKKVAATPRVTAIPGIVLDKTSAPVEPVEGVVLSAPGMK